MSDHHAPELRHYEKAERWDWVLAHLGERKRLSVSEVAARLGISESTVRRDFMEMEKAQLVRRTHGGVVGVDMAYNLATTASRGDEGVQERESIARVASTLVAPGQIVGFNGGRTTTTAARRIVSRPEFERKDGTPALTVVCAALNIATESVLRPSIRTVVLGGVAEPHSFELTGPLASATMRDLWLDIMFVGLVGLDIDAGLTCNSDAEAGVTRTMISHSRRIVGTTSADKIGQRALAGICSISTLTDLIVAGPVPENVRAHCEERSVQLHEA